MQLAGGLIGAAIGSAFGQPALGWSLGSGLVSFLQKPERQVNSQPRMDLRIPGTADGRPIPWIRGSMRVAPDWIWHLDREAHTTTTTSESGKGIGGGPQVTNESTTYTTDALLMLNVNGCIGVAEIYWNNELIWRTDSGATTGTIAASMASERWERLTVYTGAADQLPDPDYEAWVDANVGEGQAPAYRGRTTVFVKGLQLGQSGQIPQLEFVVVVDGANDDSYVVTDGWLDTTAWSQTEYSVAIDEDRSTLWLNDFTTTGNSLGGNGYAGYYDLIEETFTRIEPQAPYVTVRPTNEPCYHSHIVQEWGVYLFQAQNTLATSLNTFYVDLVSKEIIGNADDATLNVHGNGVYVKCPDPEHSRVLLAEQAGENSFLYHADGNGIPTTLIASLTGTAGLWVIVDRDGDFWINDDSSTTVYRVRLMGAGTLVEDSFSLPAGIGTHGVNNSGCWAYDRGRHCIYFFNREGSDTFKHVLRFNCDDQSVETVNAVAFDVSGGAQGRLVFNEETDQIGVSNLGFAYVIDAESGDILHTLAKPADGNFDLVSGQLALTATSMFGGSNTDDTSLPGGFGEWRFNVLTVECPSVQDVQQSLCLRTGLTAGQINVTPLSAITREVCCLPWSQITPARVPSDILMGAYFYESTMSGATIKFVPRGAAVVDEIPYADLGAHMAGEGGEEDPLGLQLVNDLETPAFTHINYINLASNFTDGSETTDRLVSTSATTNQPLDLGLGLLPAEAKGVIDSVHRDRASALLRGRIALLRSDYPALEPTDCVTVTGADGSEYRVRIVQIVDRFPLLECDIVLDDPNVLSGQGITTTDYESQTSVSLPANTVMRVIDPPILQDADDGAGVYVLRKPDREPDPGSAIFDSDNDVDFVRRVTIPEAAVFGTTLTALGDWTGPRVFDFTHKVRVNVGDGTLTSSTRALVLGSRAVNAFRIGNEIGQFVNAELVSPGVYDLSLLLRGSLGTEWAMTGHAVTEQFELLRPSGMRRLSITTAQIGTDRYYKGVTIGRTVGSANSMNFTANTGGMKPYAPVRLRISRDGSNNATMTIERRSRYVCRLVGDLGVSIPLSDLDQYRWDIYDDDTFTTLVDSLDSVGPSVEYSAAEQTAAGLTPGDPLNVSVMQKSSIVGLGYPLQRAA